MNKKKSLREPFIKREFPMLAYTLVEEFLEKGGELKK